MRWWLWVVFGVVVWRGYVFGGFCGCVVSLVCVRVGGEVF